MSTRQIRFFALPTEFFSWMQEIQGSIPIEFALEGGAQRPGYTRVELDEVVAQAEATTRPFWRFYATSPRARWPIDDPDKNPNQWGLVTCEPPQIIEQDTLLIGNVSSKSDYYGIELDAGGSAHRLFSKIKRALKKNLKNPVWIRNIKFSDEGAEPVRDIWYSEGTVEWISQGGKLRQRGVANSEFLLSDPAA